MKTLSSAALLAVLVCLPLATAASGDGVERGAARYPSTTELRVHVHGCRVTVDWEVNHSRYAVAGQVAYTWLRYSPSQHRWIPWGHRATKPEQEINEWIFGEGEAGLWRLRARFLGDSRLGPSPASAAATFRVEQTCGHPNPPTTKVTTPASPNSPL